MNKFLGLFLGLFLSLQLANAKDMTFAQVEGAFISSNNNESISRLENIVKDINKQKNIEFVVFTGNNISKPSKNNLEEFIRIANELAVPYYVVIGNKDVNSQKEFGKREYISLLKKKNKAHRKILTPNYIFQKNNIVFIVADGAKEFIPSSIGYYKNDMLSWIKSQLNRYEDKKVVIIQHFPLLPSKTKEMYNTYKADEYLEMLAEFDNVKAIISGHYDSNSETLVNGIWHITTQNVPKYRIIDILDYDTEEPVFWSTIRE